MKSNLILACAALALVACGQSTAPTEEAPAAPQDLMSQVQAMSGEDQLVAGYSALIAYQQTHPEAQPPCTSPRGTESRGIIPDTVADDSIYAAHKGSLVLSVQCGVLISRAAFDPREHWLVIYAPAATEAAVVNCADASGRDVCPLIQPAIAPAAAPATP